MRVEEPLDNHGLRLVFGHYRESSLEISGAAYQDRVKADTNFPSHRCSLAHEEWDERVCGRVRSENGHVREAWDELAKQLQPLTRRFRPQSRYAGNVTPGAGQGLDEAVLNRCAHRRHNDWNHLGGFFGGDCSGREVGNDDIYIEPHQLPG